MRRITHRLDYTLEVSIDVPSSKILGVASIRLKAGERMLHANGARYSIRDVHLGGKSLKTRQKEEVIPIKAGRTEVLRIRYEGVFRPHGEAIGREPLEYTGLINEKGVSLTGIWYPRIRQPLPISPYSDTTGKF